MDSISIVIRKDSHIDCGKLCSQIQKLIVSQLSGSQEFEKILHISLNDIIEPKQPTPKLTHQT